MEPLAQRSANAVPLPKPRARVASRKQATTTKKGTMEPPKEPVKKQLTAAEKAEMEREEREERRARVHPEDPPRYVQEPNEPDGEEGQKYAIEELLGTGGFAKCFQAELRDKKTRRTGERVALKAVRAKMHNEKMQEKFRSELQVHSKMHHPNIVEFHRSFTYGENTYVVLELCENRSLMEMVRSRTHLTSPEVRIFTIQMAGAIKYMHSKNVIHRDLKMGNIFLDANMNIKIGDFGLAALLYSSEGRRTTICGTPNYIAPEVLEKGKGGHNFEVDLWSLGIIIYAMLVGTPPFQAKSQEDIYKKVKTRDYTWPQVRYIPEDAKDLVASLLVEAGGRLTPDNIVEHNFFKEGYFIEEMVPEYRYTRPTLPTREIMESGDHKGESTTLLYKFCKQSGVGKDPNGRFWPCVGADGGKEIIAEIKEEDMKGLAPIPGSPSVYKGTKPGLPGRAGTKIPGFRDSVPAARYPSGFPAITAPTLPDVYKQPVRPKQSRAAELRGMNRPATAAASKPEEPAKEGNAELPIRPNTRGGQGLLESAPKRPSPNNLIEVLQNHRRPLTRSATTSNVMTKTEAPSARSARVSRSTSDTAIAPSSKKGETTAVRRAAPRARLETVAEVKTEQRAKVQDAKTEGEVSASKEPDASDDPTATARRHEPSDPEHKSITANSKPKTDTLSAPATRPRTSARTLAQQQMSKEHAKIISSMRLVSPKEKLERLPLTKPEVALRGCKTIHENILQAMDYENFPTDGKDDHPRKEPNFVIKWVDYTTKFGVGYILKDGSIGCLFNEPGFPTTSVLVRGGERHVANRGYPEYKDRHQYVPQDGYPIEFFESLGETGFVRAKVSPQEFSVELGEDGKSEKLGPGKDKFEDRKRRDIVLWQKFANYMSETLGKSEKEQYQKYQKRSDGTFASFYQRIGDVGIWGFGDGSFQFNFPDHTKILISSDGRYCHFLHLPYKAAENLAKTGQPIKADVLTGRGILSYPTDVLFRGVSGDKKFGHITEANGFQLKMSFILEVMSEWIEHEGVGKGFDRREKKLKQWPGPREIRKVKPSSVKLVWVTVGARGGDQSALETNLEEVCTVHGLSKH